MSGILMLQLFLLYIKCRVRKAERRGRSLRMILLHGGGGSGSMLFGCFVIWRLASVMVPHKLILMSTK